MRPSVLLKMNASLMITLGLSTIAGIITLFFFHQYESRATRAMSGDHKTILVGHLLESKAVALRAMVDSSVASAEGNSLFADKIHEIEKDAKEASIDSKELVTDSMTQVPDDLFVQYRNIKTAVFNLYREAWNSKWMTVARVMGLVLNDLENIPYSSGLKAVQNTQPKIGQVVNVVTASTLAQNTKLMIINKLNSVRGLMNSYTEAYDKSQTLKKEREQVLLKFEEKVKKFNDEQEKGLQNFASGKDNSFLKALFLFSILVMTAVAIGWGYSKTIGEMIVRTTKDYVQQLSAWISDAGNAQIEEVIKPASGISEYDEFYELTDTVVKRVNRLRREDVIIKKLVHFPYLLVARDTKKAVYWNSALSNLLKVRSVDEQGPSGYLNILRFTDTQGKVIDPIEKCILENKEISILALLRVANDGIATQTTCTPFRGHNGELDYIFIQIRDLRDENRRIENELDRQSNELVKVAEEIQNNGIPEAPAHWVRKPVAEAIHKLQDLAFNIEKERANNKREIDRIWEHFRKEFDLKQGILKRITEIQTDLVSFADTTNQTSGEIGRINEQTQNFKLQEEQLEKFFASLNKSGTNLCKSLDEALLRFEQCIHDLEQIESASTGIEVQEKNIKELVQRTSLLNINNAIMKSKTEIAQENFSPENLMLITENLNQILYQFQKAYMLIEKSVMDLKIKAKDSRENIHTQIEYTKRLFNSEYEYSNTVHEAEQRMASRAHSLAHFMIQLDRLVADVNAYQSQTTVISDKAEKVRDIFDSSLHISEVVEEKIKLTDQLFSKDNQSDTLAASS